MKFTTDRAQLHKAVKTALHAVPNNNLVEGASGLLVKVNSCKSAVEVTGTDIRTRIISRIACESSDSDGAFIVSPVLSEILRLLKGNTVGFDMISDGELQIKSENTEYRLPVKSAVMFPIDNTAYPASFISVSGIGSLLKQSAFAAASDNGANTNGVSLKLSAGVGVTEATDGKRMVSSTKRGCSDGVLSVTLHPSAVGRLCGIFDDKETVYVGVSASSAFFFTRDTVFVTMLLTAQTPPIDDFLSRIKPQYRAVTTCKELLSAIDTVSSCQIPGDDSCINLILGSNEITVTAAAHKRKSVMKIPAVCDAPAQNTGFYYSPRILMDFLRLKAGQLTLTADNRGFLVFQTDGSRYMVCPRKATVIHVPKDRSEKPEPKKKKSAKKAA